VTTAAAPTATSGSAGSGGGTGTSGTELGSGAGTETSGPAGQGGSNGTGSTIQSGKTTVVTNEVHVGRGPSSTGEAEHPSSSGQDR
jgi:hypothetical protein